MMTLHDGRLFTPRLAVHILMCAVFWAGGLVMPAAGGTITIGWCGDPALAPPNLPAGIPADIPVVPHDTNKGCHALCDLRRTRPQSGGDGAIA